MERFLIQRPIATQALITTYSKLKHYNHTEPKVDLAAGVEQDGAGNLCEGTILPL